MSSGRARLWLFGVVCAAGGLAQTAFIRLWVEPPGDPLVGARQAFVVGLSFVAAVGCFVLEAFIRADELWPWRWLWFAAFGSGLLGVMCAVSLWVR